MIFAVQIYHICHYCATKIEKIYVWINKLYLCVSKSVGIFAAEFN